MMKYKIGSFVKKNPDSWIKNGFDLCGRGMGIGRIVDPPFALGNNEIDVMWPDGRYFEDINQVLLATAEEYESQKIKK